MMSKHIPGTPLPWKIIDQEKIEGLDLRNLKSLAHISDAPAGAMTQVLAEIIGVVDAQYMAHTANAYPKLIAAIKACLPHDPAIASLLRELGEE